MYREVLDTLSKQKNLSREQVHDFLNASQSKECSPVQQAAVLSALNVKGVSDRELAYFVQEMTERIPERIHFPDAIDICGTGGSGLPRINTSTISAFILSALGVPVAKHGNKASSGRFGSFDLLEALGIHIDGKKKDLELLAHQYGLVFLYARNFHPAMKHFAEVRKEIKVPTIFNILGPLLNPAHTKRQIIGTAFPEKMELIAQTCKRLGKKQVMIVSGEDGLDEVTLTGKTILVELKNGKIRRSVLKPSSFGVKKCSFEEIKGGDAKSNMAIALEILKGTCKSRHLDLVLVNAALALKLAGKVSSYKKGYQLAKECVESGRAYQQYLSYRQASKAPSILLEIAQHTREEVEKRKKKVSLKKLQRNISASERNFKEALLRHGISLIAEIKKASPSTGNISQKRFHVPSIAKAYEKSGAAAISVLTEKKYFGGDLKNLTKAREATFSTPLLCKDFILDEYQIYEARKHGADAILLIAALLHNEHIESFLAVAHELGMDALVEVHNKEELERVLETNADIIGINNRDLHSFTINLKNTSRLSRHIKDRVIVAESGIQTKKDLQKLPQKVHAVLMGTHLMKASDPMKKIHSLFGNQKPLLKICGVQTTQEALFCQKHDVDFIGLNFVPDSPRKISYQQAQKIISSLRKNPLRPTKIVGVFKDQSEREVNMAATTLSLDFVQLSGKESISFVKACSKPVIKGISLRRKSDLKKAQRFSKVSKYILLDGKEPGSGKMFDHRLLEKFPYPYFLAGGMNQETIPEVLKKIHPYGIDLASGVEREGKRDLKKIQKILQIIRS